MLRDRNHWVALLGGSVVPFTLTMDVQTLNECDRSEFVRVLGEIFEHSPWVAEGVVDDRPFAARADLHGAMVAVVRRADPEAHLTLIRAHPDLGARVRLSTSSTAEQASAGLDQMPETEFRRFHDLNSRYRERFGFPFIIAVRDTTRAGILEAFERRLGNNRDEEIRTALEQIERIAEIRLEQLLLAIALA